MKYLNINNLLEDPSAEYGTASDEITVITKIPVNEGIEEVIVVAPGQGKTQSLFWMVSFVRDLDIHIFSQQGSQIAKVKEVFGLAQVNTSIKGSWTIYKNLLLIVTMFFSRFSTTENSVKQSHKYHNEESSLRYIYSRNVT